MKKIIYILICLLLNLSVFAATLSEKFNSFLDPIENFNKKEHIIYKDSFDKTNEEFKSIWNLNSKRLPKFKKDSSEINIKNPETFADILKHDLDDANEIYSEWQKNKNNMKNNAEIVDYIKSEYINPIIHIEQINKIYKDYYNEYLQSLYKNDLIHCAKNKDTNGIYYCYSKYKNSQYISTLDSFKNKLINEDKNSYICLFETSLKDNLAKYQDIIDNIITYSKAYEEKKLNNFYVSRYGQIKNGGMLSAILVADTIPSKNFYYDTYTPLYVVQVLNGGIIVRDTFPESNSKYAYIETNKKFVDKQNVTGRFLYIGTYKYKNLLGVTKIIYKFKEIAIPNEDFYFINK